MLNAAGYIVAAHRIEVAAKVIGKVKWIGVDKGDRVVIYMPMVPEAVVAMLACPSNSCNTRRSQPPASRCVAKVWRSVCGVTS